MIELRKQGMRYAVADKRHCIGGMIYICLIFSLLYGHNVLAQAPDFENDLNTRQVAIEALVVEIDEEYTRNLGLTYTLARNDKGTGNNLKAIDVRFPYNPDLVPVPTIGKIGNTEDYGIGRSYQFPGVGLKLNGINVGPARLSASLRALLNEGHAEIRAHAIAVALHNTFVTIETVDEVPFQDVKYDEARNVTKLDVSFEEVGVKLNARPTIKDLGKGRISLLINEVNLSSVSGFVTIQQVSRPIFANSSANTIVEITSGETFVLGGFKTRRDVVTESGIPLLRRIPILGYLFKSQKKVQENKDVLFFITPYLLRPGTSPILPYDFQHGKFLEINNTPVKY